MSTKKVFSHDLHSTIFYDYKESTIRFNVIMWLFSAHSFELAKVTPLGSEHPRVQNPSRLDTRQSIIKSYRPILCSICSSSSCFFLYVREPFFLLMVFFGGLPSYKNFCERPCNKLHLSGKSCERLLKTNTFNM